ncbi:DDE-domain-containing protein [Amniculicola lignicola CBS 123094]|uniref:DDE-domain-containing protein n=1 Tax=Amniculicola lignicola CBS 123094 TaxID=1392246 RepID=A0A6A5WDQ3_9PLEO|nr:DDE-domain-containing protein [Amniculicola lignicola CBS 123094]
MHVIHHGFTNGTLKSWALQHNARELAIQLATRDYNAGTFTSQRAAAKATTTSTASYQYQQRLTPLQEDFLMANRILRMNGDNQPLRVASVIGRKLEAQRAETRQRLNIQTENIYNIDETGVTLGVCINTRVLSSSKKKKAYIQSPENCEWVSIIECVSATGQKLRCTVIFKGKNLQMT